MTDPRERLQRRMLQQATKNRKTQEQTKRRRPRKPMQEPEAEKLFCHCLAVVVDNECPRCAGDTAAPKFCRNCMDVHAPTVNCKPWKLADGKTPGRPATYRAGA